MGVLWVGFKDLILALLISIEEDHHWEVKGAH
jgi:hypothetical protein